MKELIPGKNHYFISAIGTDSGKTVVSAIVCEALKADYWKPVQCGFPTDTETVKSLVSNSETQFLEEVYLLETPASPHIAAANEQHELFLPVIQTEYQTILPSRPTVIEGAGGLMVPLNNSDFIIDIPQQLNVPVILVANLYLGSINHTLLSVEALKARKLEVAGIVFNGEDPQGTKEIILQTSGYRELLHIRKEDNITPDSIIRYANELLSNLASNSEPHVETH